MPRFSLPFDPFGPPDLSDPDAMDEMDPFDELHDDARIPRGLRRRAPDRSDSHRRPRVATEGRSGRADVDADVGGDGGDLQDGDAVGSTAGSRDGAARADACAYSSYDVAAHGPEPVPGWLVTALSARDAHLGDLKSGKEADVRLLERAVPGGASCLLAVKTYRRSEHRMFHRDAGYVEGRRIRRSRETRAMAKRTAFGRDLLAGQWAAAEFGALSALWASGARVPYPVQLIGTELMMQFIGGPDGTAAPRLAAHDAPTAEFGELWHDLVASLEVLAAEGMTHGDLSPYNVLVGVDGCVLIDLPQVVDLIGNPQGEFYLQRDCRVITDFFARRGVHSVDSGALAEHLRQIATSRG